MTATREVRTLYLASGNAGKLKEFRVLAEAGRGNWQLELLLDYAKLPEFEEAAPTFAENATGKAFYYSRGYDGIVFADDSGLVVPALGGAPGVLSARYAGPSASSEQKIAKLLFEMKRLEGANRSAYFVCVIAAVRAGRAIAVVSEKVDGEILEAPRGAEGFGYDPVFFFPPLEKSFAELRAEEKSEHSHRGKAFRRLLEVLE
ncbi:MAG TPA: RdgB/HAM1 family non-canonical purine NTP pyrophosphatase [Candidatus Sulfotelmatobacter sp.]|jgi:non-canonical purine NTP pyrophosphatase (RdgB/HAM1 family)|nr:RdgB/HAM1 family non-canonical purine NTP pyrophosphatase [Candidatus Sulfotelmatobacter sp.]